MDVWYELPAFCYSQGKVRGRAARSWTDCPFAAGGDGSDGHLGWAVSVCAWVLPLAAIGAAEHCKAWADVEQVVGQ